MKKTQSLRAPQTRSVIQRERRASRVLKIKNKRSAFNGAFSFYTFLLDRRFFPGSGRKFPNQEIVALRQNKG